MILKNFLILSIVGCSLYVNAYSYQVPNPTTSYANKKILVDNAYYLFWNYTSEDILFEIHVKTKGWAAFGLSPNGGMLGSDVIVTWIDDNGVNNFTDRHIASGRKVLIDKEKDWFLLYSASKDGFLISKFTRKIKLCKKDLEDIDIEEGTPFLIFAWNDYNPGSNGDISYHESNRGSKTVPIISSLNLNVELDMNEIETVDFRVNGSITNGVDTEYFCQMFKLPEEWAKNKRHLIRYETLSNKETEEHLHHWILNECTQEFETEYLKFNQEPQPGTCYSPIPSEIQTKWTSLKKKYCQKSSLVWAYGGDKIQDFPKDLAYPLGGSEKEFKYFILEIHYDNPKLKKDIKDHSGFRMYVTKNFRKTEFGVYSVGAVTEWFAQLIPPKQDLFPMDFFCRKDCLNQITSRENLTVFATLPHTHLKGVEFYSTVIRNGTEIGFLTNNKHYDFNYQFLNFLSNPFVLQKNDEIKVRCVYSSKNISTFTPGGHATLEEMCVNFIWYYPKVDGSSLCFETYTVDKFGEFLINLNSTGDVEFSYNQTSINVISENPSKQMVEKFQSFYNQERIGICLIGNGSEIIKTNENFPYKLYQEPECVVSSKPNIFLPNNSIIIDPPSKNVTKVFQIEFYFNFFFKLFTSN